MDNYNQYRQAFQEKGLIAVPLKGTTAPDGKAPYSDAKYKRFSSFHSFKDRPFTEEEMQYYFNKEKKGEIGLGVVLGKVKDDLYLIGFDVDKMVVGNLSDFCNFCVDNGLAFEESARKGIHIYGYANRPFPDSRGVKLELGGFVVEGDLWGNGSMYFVTAPTKINEGEYRADASMIMALFDGDFNYYPKNFLDEFEKGTIQRAEKIKKYTDVKINEHDVASFVKAYSTKKVTEGERHDFLLEVCKDIYKRVYKKKSVDESISLAFEVLKGVRDGGVIENGKDKDDRELKDIATYCYGYRKKWEEEVSTPEFKKIIENYKNTGHIPMKVDDFKKKYIKNLVKKFDVEEHKKAVEEIFEIKKRMGKMDSKDLSHAKARLMILSSYVYTNAYKRILSDKANLKYDREGNRFYDYNGEIYYEIEGKVFESEIMDLLAQYGLDGFLTRAKTQDVIARMIKHTPAFIKTKDDNRTVVGNGILNIKTLELVNHTPEFVSTTRIATNYNTNVEFVGSRFEQFINEITSNMAGQARLLQQFTGYLLSPSTKYQKALIMVGEGSNGKSLYTRLLKDLVGGEAFSVMKAEDLNKNFGVSNLVNKRVNICDETSGKYLDSHILKSLISGEDQLCDVKYKNQLHFTPEVKIIMTVNDLPAVSDTSYGFYRRFIQMEMLASFTEEKGNIDPQLYNKLKDEKEIILKWALAGYQDLEREGGFSVEERNVELLKEYRMENDPTERFVANNFEPSESDSVSLKDAYKHYKDYSQDIGKKAKSITNFAKDLKRVADNSNGLFQYEPRKNGHDHVKIKGVKINPEWLSEFESDDILDENW